MYDINLPNLQVIKVKQVFGGMHAVPAKAKRDRQMDRPFLSR